MVTKKRKAAPRRRTYAARRAAPRRRAKSGVQYIPGAAATVALVVAEAPLLKSFYNAATNNGNDIMGAPSRMMKNTRTINSMKAFLTVDNITKAGLALGGGYVAGEIVRKYAPGVIKRPLGKIAKKIPKVL